MANLYTRKQIAELIERSPQQVRGEILRGNLIEENKRIDIHHPINRAFIAKWTTKDSNIETKKEEKEYPVIKLKANPNIKELSYSQLRDEKLIREVEKLDIETQLKNLEYKKKKAKVLPLDFIIDWSGRNIRGIFGETVNFGNSIIEQICNELDADTEIKLKYKKMFKQGFNEMVKDGIKKQEPEALEHAKEYSLTTKW